VLAGVAAGDGFSFGGAGASAFSGVAAIGRDAGWGCAHVFKIAGGWAETGEGGAEAIEEEGNADWAIE